MIKSSNAVDQLRTAVMRKKNSIVPIILTGSRILTFPVHFFLLLSEEILFDCK